MNNGESSYRRFLDGDDSGIVEIVEAYKDGLTLFLYHFVNRVDVAEELTEETFFRLMIKKPKFSGRSSFRSWLYAIGRNVAVDYLRHNAKIKAVSAGEAETVSCAEDDLERSYIKEESKITVHKALDHLPAEYRQVLWLVFFEDLSYGEASAVMKKNSRQMRNLLYRAKQRLKSELEKEGFVYEDD